MAAVVVRVELHGATTEEQYSRLHDAMRRAGFGRTITSGDGTQYWLPTATYRSATFADASTAQAAAWEAAKGIAPSYEVIATCGSSSWRGLKAV